MSKKTKESSKRVNSLVLLIAFTAILLIASTYAWFSTQKNVSINNLQGRVRVSGGLKISLDAASWNQSISFGSGTDDISEDWAAYDKGLGLADYPSKNYRPSMTGDSNNGYVNSIHTQNIIAASASVNNATGYMVPVSTTAQDVTSNIIPMFKGTYEGYKLSDINQISETANNEYYAFDIYLMDTSDTNDTSAENTLQLGYASTVEEIKREADANDYGLQNCVRVAFAVYDGTADTNADASAVGAATYNSDIESVAIWEPNYDTHSEYVLKQNDKLKGLAGDAATNGAYNSITTYAVKTDTAANAVINDVYETDTNLAATYTVQTSGLTQNGTLNYVETVGNASGNKNLVSAEDGTTEVKIAANKISRVRVYVWLEGQDPDCVNWAAQSYGINTNIVLCKDQETASDSEDRFKIY